MQGKRMQEAEKEDCKPKFSALSGAGGTGSLQPPVQSRAAGLSHLPLQGTSRHPQCSPLLANAVAQRLLLLQSRHGQAQVLLQLLDLSLGAHLNVIQLCIDVLVFP